MLYDIDLCCTEPLHSLAHVPQAELVFLAATSVYPKPMLLSSIPPAPVLSAVWPCVYAVTLFEVLDHLTIVLDLVRIEVVPVSVHLVGFPLPAVHLPIYPDLLAKSFYLVRKPLPLVR